MTAAAKTIDELDEPYEEISVERLVRLPEASFPTRRTKVDDRLLAIARGELEPDNAFGGLIPIYDDELANEVEDGWLFVDASSPSTDEAMLGRAVPRVRMRMIEVNRLPLSARAVFLVGQIDGVRTIEQLVDICELEELESLEILDELLRAGAIELA